MTHRRAVRFAGWLAGCWLVAVLMTGCAGGNTPQSQVQPEGPQESVAEKQGVVRIGYQKTGPILLLKQRQTLEQLLEPQGYTVEWSEFNTGLSVVEALASGNIDFGTVGDAPSIFGLARGLDFVYVASESSAPETEGILVHGDSPIQTIADLKGKKVAYNKASIAQYLLTKALESVGLTMDDVQSVYLVPSDASIAFAQGDVDAWVVWDPYFSVAAANGNRILTDAKGLVPYRTFYLSRQEFVNQHPEVVQSVIGELQKAGEEMNENPHEAAEILSQATRIPVSVWESVLKKKRSDAHFIDQQAIDDLQRLADDFLQMGLIDKSIQVDERAWRP
jgi:sulfonate transport system substrate-binding protein